MGHTMQVRLLQVTVSPAAAGFGFTEVAADRIDWQRPCCCLCGASVCLVVLLCCYFFSIFCCSNTVDITGPRDDMGES